MDVWPIFIGLFIGMAATAILGGVCLCLYVRKYSKRATGTAAKGGRHRRLGDSHSYPTDIEHSSSGLNHGLWAVPFSTYGTTSDTGHSGFGGGDSGSHSCGGVDSGGSGGCGDSGGGGDCGGSGGGGGGCD